MGKNRFIIQKIRAIAVFFADIRLHIYAVLLFVSTFLWMALPYNAGPDFAMHKWVGAIRMELPGRHKLAKEDVIFIDVSKSRYLLPIDEDSTVNEVITNRKYLADLFTLLAANYDEVRYVFCDVFFNMPTPDDSLLVQAAAGLKDKFLSIDTDNGNSLNKNLLGVRSATATLNFHRFIFYKIPFFGQYGDTLVSFKMYSDLEKVKVRKNFLFTWFSGKGISFNNQIIDLQLRSWDFNNEVYDKVGLGELVSTWQLNPIIFDLSLKNRYILIGDFETDIHRTFLTMQPGTLILFNAFLHLLHNRQILPVWYLIILYIFLYWIIWLRLGKKSHHLKITFKIKYFEPFVFPINIFSISLLLLIFSYVSSLLFGVNISIFHLITIFSLVDFVKFIWNKRIRTKK